MEELKLEKDTSRHPIFQVMFGVQSFGLPESHVSQEGLFYKSYLAEGQHLAAKFDLSLIIDDSGENLGCILNYATSLFKEESRERLAKHYRYLIEQITNSYEEGRFREDKN